MKMPKHLQEKVTTRSRSKKQESNLAKVFKGRATLNSGATFGENDVLTDFCEIEAKTTKHKSFKLNLDDLKLMRKKSSIVKTPIMVLAFEDNLKEQYAILKLSDLAFYIEQANNR